MYERALQYAEINTRTHEEYKILYRSFSCPCLKILRVLYHLQDLQDPHGLSMERKRLDGCYKLGPLHLLEGGAEGNMPEEERTSQEVQGSQGGHSS